VGPTPLASSRSALLRLFSLAAVAAIVTERPSVRYFCYPLPNLRRRSSSRYGRVGMQRKSMLREENPHRDEDSKREE
jgi:hypothetical protein